MKLTEVKNLPKYVCSKLKNLTILSKSELYTIMISIKSVRFGASLLT